MSYVYDPNQDPENPQNTQIAGGGSQIVGGQGQAAFGSAQTPGANPAKSGSYQNLNSYLDANQGSDFGQQFTGKLNDSVTGANQAQQEASQSFKQKSDAGSVYDNPSYTTSISQDPAAFASNAGNVSGFQNQLNAQYKGPYSYSDDASDYQKAYGSTRKAQQETSAAQSEPGRFALLNNYFGSPTYNRGQTTLDNLLLQGNEQTQQGINQARENANQSAASFQNQSAELGNYAAQNLGKTESARNTARNALGLDEQGQFKEDSDYKTQQGKLTKEAEDFEAAKDSKRNAALSEYLSPNDVGGWSSDLYGADPGSYLSYQGATAKNVQDPQTRARINALEQLSGSAATTPWETSTPGYSVDKATLQGDVGRLKGEYSHALNNLKTVMPLASNQVQHGGGDLDINNAPVYESFEKRLTELDRFYHQPDGTAAMKIGFSNPFTRNKSPISNKPPGWRA